MWTAFVTDLLEVPSMAKRNKNRVGLRHVRPYIFCDDYRPSQGDEGEVVLDFESSEGRFTSY